MVLVVDDEPLIRALLRTVFVQEGYDVIEAGDRRAAMTAMADRPDLVLLDVMLDGESGLDVLAAVRAADDVPVMLVTGSDDDGDRKAGLQLAADDFIVKPFSVDDLVRRAALLLGRARSGRRC
jgi:DNA-binding response OmpR family regulator